jgi:hypothetical protein
VEKAQLHRWRTDLIVRRKLSNYGLVKLSDLTCLAPTRSKSRLKNSSGMSSAAAHLLASESRAVTILKNE